MPNNYKMSLLPTFLIFIFVILLSVLANMMPSVHHEKFAAEFGIIQIASGLGYIIAAILLLCLKGKITLSVVAFVVILMAMALREFDFHSKLTTISITRTRFYISPNVPIIEKLLAVLVLAGIFAAVAFILRKYSKVFIADLSAFEPGAVSLALAGLLLAFSKAIDGLGRKLVAFGFEMQEKLELRLVLVEEIAELALPIALSMAVIAYLWRPRTGSF